MITWLKNKFLKPVQADIVLEEKKWEYPKWRHLIPSEFTQETVRDAFIVVFGHDPLACKIIFTSNNMTVYAPNETIHHGGFGYHTESPKISDPQKVYFIGAGCSWSVDDNGERYYLIDKATNLPCRWNEVVAREIISLAIKGRLVSSGRAFLKINDGKI